MFNIGLEVLDKKDNNLINWSFEQLTNLSNDLIKYFDTIGNLIIIKESLTKYGKTNQLVDLVGSSFEEAGITFSTEGITESIKKFFQWIRDKLTALWNWFIGLFKSNKKTAETATAMDARVIEIANAINSNDPAAMEKAADEFEKLIGSLAGVEDAIKNNVPASDSSITVNVVNMEKALEILNGYNTTADAYKEHLAKLYSDISLKYATTDESAENTKRSKDDIIEYINNSKFPEKEEMTIDIKEAVSISRNCKNSIHSVIPMLADMQTKIQKLNSLIKASEPLVLKNPDNKKFANLNRSCRDSLTLAFESIKFINKFITISKNTQKTIGLALVKLARSKK